LEQKKLKRLLMALFPILILIMTVAFFSFYWFNQVKLYKEVTVNGKKIVRMSQQLNHFLTSNNSCFYDQKEYLQRIMQRK